MRQSTDSSGLILGGHAYRPLIEGALLFDKYLVVSSGELTTECNINRPPAFSKRAFTEKQMNTYLITEKQNVGSTRNGNLVEASSLTSAKSIATRTQCFTGTVLTIERNEILVAYKENGKWNDIKEYV